MKHRNDFVSNSSSTCYMISVDNDNSKKLFEKDTYSTIDRFFKYDLYSIIDTTNIRKELVDSIIKNDSEIGDYMDYNPETGRYELNSWNFHIQTLDGWEDIKLDFKHLDNIILTSTASLLNLISTLDDKDKQIIINNVLYTICETEVEEQCDIYDILNAFKKWLNDHNITFSMCDCIV